MKTPPPSPKCSGTLPVRIEGGVRVLGEILEGGQSFQWVRAGASSWQGVCGPSAYRLTLRENGRISWECLGESNPQSASDLHTLFAGETDFATLAEQLPWRTDPVLAHAVRAFRGLRILRQSPSTTLLSFLLSPLKRIAQIRAGLQELSRTWGTEVANGFWSAPSWASLAAAEEIELRACGIGYRAKSIHRTARILAEEPELLPKVGEMPTVEARAQLCHLPGVGKKIADCVLLFAYGRLEAFPIDTWIARKLREDYHLEDFREAHLQAFARAHFGPAAGFAQQFLFAAARAKDG